MPARASPRLKRPRLFASPSFTLKSEGVLRSVKPVDCHPRLDLRHAARQRLSVITTSVVFSSRRSAPFVQDELLAALLAFAAALITLNHAWFTFLSDLIFKQQCPGCSSTNAVRSVSNRLFGFCDRRTRLRRSWNKVVVILFAHLT